MSWRRACSHSYARAISRAITSRIRRDSEGSNIVVTCHETRQKIWLQAKGVYHLSPAHVNLWYTPLTLRGLFIPYRRLILRGGRVYHLYPGCREIAPLGPCCRSMRI